MNEKKVTPFLQSKNWKNLFYFAQKEFILLYSVKVTFKLMASLWVSSWGQYYPDYLS